MITIARHRIQEEWKIHSGWSVVGLNLLSFSTWRHRDIILFDFSSAIFPHQLWASTPQKENKITFSVASDCRRVVKSGQLLAALMWPCSSCQKDGLRSLHVCFSTNLSLKVKLMLRPGKRFSFNLQRRMLKTAFDTAEWRQTMQQVQLNEPDIWSLLESRSSLLLLPAVIFGTPWFASTFPGTSSFSI